MLAKVYTHDPDAILDYYLDWSVWLEGSATLVTSTWEAIGSVTLAQDSILGSFTGVWVMATDEEGLVDLINHVVDSEGREDDCTIRLILRN
jgi:hypothetical protein